MSFLPSLSVTWSLVILMVTLLLIYGVWPYGFFKKLGIPGPRPWPIVGTFLSYRKGFFNFDMECFKKFGKVWGIYDGRLPILMVLDLEMIKVIMVKECFSTFTNRRDTNMELAGAFSDGITIVKDEKWKRIRASLSPFFTSGRLKEIFPIAEKHADRLIDNLKKKNLDEAIKVKEVFAPYSMDVVTSASFSVEIDSINNPDDPFVTQIKKFFNFSFFSPLFLIITFFPFLTPVLAKLGVTLFSKSTMEFFYSSLRTIKDQHIKNGNRRVDFLQLMIEGQISDEKAEEASSEPPVKGLTDHEILSQSFIFILGGYETTSTTLTFLLYNLATNPDCMSKLVEEIDDTFPDDAPVTYDVLMKMKYLEMAINESMRLLPTAPRLERMCKKTIDLNGVTIPKNTLVAIPTYVLNRDPQLWESPEEFRPERFDPDYINPYVFMPFGLGPRNCVGMRFALMIMKLAIVKLLQNFYVKTCKETQIPIQLTALFQPKVPVTLKLVPRSHREK